MRTLYLDCNMGAAGDMLMAALVELLPNPEEFIHKLNHLGVPGVTVSLEKVQKCGIMGSHISIKIHGEEEESVDISLHSHEHEKNHHHHHSHSHKEECHHYSQGHEKDHHHHHSHTSLKDIQEIVTHHLSLSEKVQKDILAVYTLIAKAEATVHGKSVEQVHFHEVGAMDAVMDIVGVCLLMEELNVEYIVASPIHTGCGHVHCAHGILPVPAPATAHILQGVPVYSGKIQGELCTPTGAALLKHFVHEFGEMPVAKIRKIGYGMGKKDFPVANCVRSFLCETENTTEEIYELSCNLDDMTPEEVGFAMEQLFQAGALDVYATPITMKKSRSGILLSVLCKVEEKEKLVKAFFQHTTTIGIREKKYTRYELQRQQENIVTPYGEVSRKKSWGYGVERYKYEYEDLAQIARVEGKSIFQIRESLDGEE